MLLTVTQREPAVEVVLNVNVEVNWLLPKVVGAADKIRREYERDASMLER